LLRGKDILESPLLPGLREAVNRLVFALEDVEDHA
jgi:hypothetical protein